MVAVADAARADTLVDSGATLAVEQKASDVNVTWLPYQFGKPEVCVDREALVESVYRPAAV